MRKIYIVPNLVTTGGMLCGFYSAVLSFQGEFVTAAWAILAAGIFDSMDGRIARLARATSQFGVEYDSLADIVSFGMAPAFLIYNWALEPFGRLGILASFLLVACTALRLARFNVQTEIAPKGFFLGLPCPVSACLIASFIIFENATGVAFADSLLMQRSVFGAVVLLSVLMISTVRFPSFKELNWRSKATFGYLLIGLLMMVLIAARPEISLFLVGFAYLGLSLLYNLVTLMTGKGASRKAGTRNAS